MRIAFLGTPDFAVRSLAELASAGHEIAAVYTQPQKPRGRGHEVRPSPVQGMAERFGLPGLVTHGPVYVIQMNTDDGDSVSLFGPMPDDIPVVVGEAIAQVRQEQGDGTAGR